MTTFLQGSIPLQTVTYRTHNGETPLLDQVAPSTFVPAIVRTDPFTALTPNEIELNREVAYLAFNPKVTV